jgi:hypothetical protein
VGLEHASVAMRLSKSRPARNFFGCSTWRSFKRRWLLSGEDSSGPIRHRFASRGECERGRDYRGSDTRQDPYIFVNELQYQGGFPRLPVLLSLDMS